MRSSLLASLAALALVGAACLAPTAAAAPTALTIETPTSTPANSTVPIGITLRIGGFLCHQPHNVTVALATTNTDGVRGVFQQSSVSFELPARSFFAEDYVETRTVNLSVRAIAAGAIDMSASFAADVGPCFVPGGFDPANASATLFVDPPSVFTGSPPPAENETENGTTPGNETTTDGNATTETPPATPAATPTPRATTPRAPSCGPDGGCGKIGDYDAPQESANDTPSASLLAVMGVVALAALGFRRRRSS